MNTFNPSNISGNGLPITLTASMLERIIKMKSGEQDVKVEITPVHIVLFGTTEVKKMMFKKNVPFRITLKPIHVEKRTISFELVEMKPIDRNFINQKIFNRPPFFEFENRMIKMNFNAWNIVKRIPVGTIKSYELVEGALKIKLSL
ncbi:MULTISPECIES: hypothetical protein [unclassified Peribacillus]|uniref:hypothetical protein n=1 Tax=unclassified Peribacillus TaxID=2675266 RepID=UPI00191399B5|nr:MULTISPECIES: hypothetical protein [unclassified Peribacillus]MBK5461597.1 hypothetical protein [Peribacillus sp. TH27]MBK5485082.1 hypothetical protein [Peribacillus sp. TH16]MBK5499740.1 hypothetical protein [Peribacillus sp. TH14]WMX55174.1 hypothetical protein RE409_24640 [Peribacillus sp. R9-11]